MKFLWFLVVVLLIIVGVLSYLLLSPLPKSAPTPTSESPEVPAATTTPAQPEAQAPLHERVHVSSPAASSTVGNTFAVSGEAPGGWYFEASFPIQVRDMDGNILARALGQAQGEWMTDTQVPFTAKIALEKFYSGPAILILMRDNPSGLPEHDDSLEIPLTIQ